MCPSKHCLGRCCNGVWTRGSISSYCFSVCSQNEVQSICDLWPQQEPQATLQCAFSHPKENHVLPALQGAAAEVQRPLHAHPKGWWSPGSLTILCFSCGSGQPELIEDALGDCRWSWTRPLEVPFSTDHSISAVRKVQGAEACWQHLSTSVLCIDYHKDLNASNDRAENKGLLFL